MKRVIVNSILLVMAMAFFFRCEKEKPFEGPAPTVLVLNYEGGLILQEPNADVVVDVQVGASAGIELFEIFINDSLIRSETYSDEFRFDFSYTFRIPENAQDGENFNHVFKVTGSDGVTAESQIVRIRAGNPYSVSEETIDGIVFTVIKGRINEDLKLSSGTNWLMDSVVSVENDVTLTINEGTTVYFRSSPSDQYVSRLAITQGSRIVAEGSPVAPIVFTSDKVLLGGPQQQDWGGLFLCGNAPTNQGSALLEDGFRYGGNSVTDNSGTLSYVRIEYAGKDELHALQLHGVGRSTTLDHIQVWECYNIGIRIRGGDFRIKYLAAINHGGYGLWADEGWQGEGQFWLFQTDIMATLIPINYWNQARSLEFRNDENFFLNQPRTNFKIANVTLIGNGWEEGGSFGTRRGFRVRRGALGVLQNVLVTNFPDDAARVEDLDLQELGTDMILDNSRVWGNRVNWGQEAESFFFSSGNYNLTEDPVNGLGTENFVGSVSSPFNPIALGSWFDSAPYMGAVENNANDWTAEGEWFKDINGNIR